MRAANAEAASGSPWVTYTARGRPSILAAAPKWLIQVSSSVWSAWAERPVMDRTRQRTGQVLPSMRASFPPSARCRPGSRRPGSR